MSLLFTIAGPPTRVYVGLSFANLDAIADDRPFRRDLSVCGVPAMLFLMNNSIGLPKETYLSLTAEMVKSELGDSDLNAVVLDIGVGLLKRLRGGRAIDRDYTERRFPVPFHLTLVARQTEQDLYVELRESGIEVPEVAFGTDGSPLRLQ